MQGWMEPTLPSWAPELRGDNGGPGGPAVPSPRRPLAQTTVTFAESGFPPGKSQPLFLIRSDRHGLQKKKRARVIREHVHAERRLLWEQHRPRTPAVCPPHPRRSQCPWSSAHRRGARMPDAESAHSPGGSQSSVTAARSGPSSEVGVCPPGLFPGTGAAAVDSWRSRASSGRCWVHVGCPPPPSNSNPWKKLPVCLRDCRMRRLQGS